jgi:hypothetical protein
LPGANRKLFRGDWRQAGIRHPDEHVAFFGTARFRVVLSERKAGRE